MYSGAPFFKLFIAFAMGIVLSVYLEVFANVYVLFLSFLSLILYYFLANKKSNLIPHFGLVFFVFLLTLGSYQVGVKKSQTDNTCIGQKGSKVARLIKSPKTTEWSVRAYIETKGNFVNHKWTPTLNKSLLILQKDSLSQGLKNGDYINFNAKFEAIEEPKNPEVFNYKRYLFNQGVAQQVNLKSGQWRKLDISKPFWDFSQISDFRTFLLSQYKYFGIQGDELAVLSALTLGYKNDLDSEIRKTYASSGAIHVLAVSGLHVGVVFIIINFLLKRLGKSKTQRIIRLIITLLFIWFFALLTGFAPSVQRASWMLTALSIGVAINRKGTTENSIFLSAFFIAFFNPYILFDLSYQLSYAAVLSIVFFQPKIFELLEFNNKIMKYFWALTSVSLAAQIGTVPITIFYFNQFPNYFLLSNFIVIPFASIAIWGSMLFYLSLLIGFFSKWIALALMWLIRVQNYLIGSIESLPFALSEKLYIDKIQLIVLIAIILMLMQFLKWKKAKYVIVLFSLTLIFVLYYDFRFFEQSSQKGIVVYNTPNHCTIDLINKNEHYFFSSLNENSSSILFNVKPYWLSKGLDKRWDINTIIFRDSEVDYTGHRKNLHFFRPNLLQFLDNRIMLFDSKEYLLTHQTKPINVDYLIISKSVKVEINVLKKYYIAEQIIVDASNYKDNIEFWLNEKKIHPLQKIHIVAVHGAFIDVL